MSEILVLTPTALALRGEELLVEATALQVVDPESFQIVAAIRAAAKSYEKQVHALCDPVVESTRRARDAALDQRTKLLERSQRVLALVDKELGRYEQEQRRLRATAEAEARKQAEALRLEAEAKQRAQMEALRKQADERQLQAALEAEAKGDTKLAEAIVDTAHVIAEPEPLAIFVPPPVVEMPKAEGLSFRDKWEFEVVDVALLPREYLIPNEKKIRAVVEVDKELTKIPGVRVFVRRIPVQRLTPA